MKVRDLKNLIKMRDKVRSLEGIKCGMLHEKVALDSSSNLPIRIFEEGNSLKRINLCPAEIRSKRLACGHTNARNFIKLFLLSLELYKEFAKPEIRQLYNKVDKIDIEICMLDHKKGDAELNFGLRLNEVFRLHNGEKSPGEIIDKDLKSEREEIQKIESAHDKYVRDMLNLKSEILETVNKVINKESRRVKHKIFLKLF